MSVIDATINKAQHMKWLSKPVSIFTDQKKINDVLRLDHIL